MKTTSQIKMLPCKNGTELDQKWFSKEEIIKAIENTYQVTSTTMMIILSHLDTSKNQED